LCTAVPPGIYPAREPPPSWAILIRASFLPPLLPGLPGAPLQLQLGMGAEDEPMQEEITPSGNAMARMCGFPHLDDAGGEPLQQQQQQPDRGGGVELMPQRSAQHVRHNEERWPTAGERGAREGGKVWRTKRKEALGGGEGLQGRRAREVLREGGQVRREARGWGMPVRRVLKEARMGRSGGRRARRRGRAGPLFRPF
jgi:hypothetical protein